MSKLKVNELDTESGTTVTVTTGKTLDIPAGGTINVAGTQTVTGTQTVPGTQTVTGTANLTGATLTLPATLPATALTNATNIPAISISDISPLIILLKINKDSSTVKSKPFNNFFLISLICIFD